MPRNLNDSTAVTVLSVMVSGGRAGGFLLKSMIISTVLSVLSSRLLKETPPFFHIPICSFLNLDELICTSPISVRALNHSSTRHHYAIV